jgi:hypothetical protein
MSTDVFVMPLWRYKVGDFETALERSGLAPEVHYISSEGPISRVPLRSRFDRWRAKRVVKRLAREVSRANGHPVSWRDEGDLVHVQQLHTVHPLKAYLWWLDRRDLMPTFSLPPDGGPAARPFWETAPDRPASYPHLSTNGFYNDYFLPAEFEKVVSVEPHKVFGTWDADRRVSSSPRALREVETVNQSLQVPDPYEWSEDDPLASVKSNFDEVRRILQISVRHGLPVIFWS